MVSRTRTATSMPFSLQTPHTAPTALILLRTSQARYLIRTWSWRNHTNGQTASAHAAPILQPASQVSSALASCTAALHTACPRNLRRKIPRICLVTAPRMDIVWSWAFRVDCGGYSLCFNGHVFGARISSKAVSEAIFSKDVAAVAALLCRTRGRLSIERKSVDGGLDRRAQTLIRGREVWCTSRSSRLGIWRPHV